MDFDEPVSLSPKARMEHERYRRWQSRFVPDQRFVVPRFIARAASIVLGCALFGIAYHEWSTGIVVAGVGIALFFVEHWIRATFRGPSANDRK